MITRGTTAFGRRPQSSVCVAEELSLGGFLTGIIACIFLSGCAFILPVGSSRRPLGSTKQDFSNVRLGATTREELTNQLGAMNHYCPELRLGCYEVNEVTQKRLWLAFGIVPVGMSKDSLLRDVVYLEFDELDRVRRYTNATAEGKFLNEAAHWAANGRWRCELAIVNGEHLPEEKLSRLGILLEDRQLWSKIGNGVLFNGSYSIDTIENPVRFTLRENAGPHKRRTADGVILLRGNSMEICYVLDRPYRSRQTTFESSPGSGTYWFVWKRGTR